MMTSVDVDEAADIFNSNVLGVLDRHAPMVERRIRHDSPPWVDEVLLNAISERDYLKKIASKGAPLNGSDILKNEIQSSNLTIG